jgi:acyl-CoA dehydrogenase
MGRSGLASEALNCMPDTGNKETIVRYGNEEQKDVG